MIDLFKLEEEVRDLIMEFQANKEKIRSLIAQVAPDFNKEVGKTIIYADMFSGDPSARNHRLSLFVMMYEECEALRNYAPMTFDLFMEAYVNSCKYVASMTIEKKDVISVQYEYHNDICHFEILTLKNEGVKYREVVIKR